MTHSLLSVYLLVSTDYIQQFKRICEAKAGMECYFSSMFEKLTHFRQEEENINQLKTSSSPPPLFFF